MQITAIKTPKILAGAISLEKLLDDCITQLPQGSVLAITSKVVSLCEGGVVPFGEIDKERLAIRESDKHLPKELNKYGYYFTIKNDTLIPMAGIDESNGDGNYVLWPKDSQKSANDVREYLKNRFKLTNIGVVITDSTCQPMRRGTIGIALAHSGFLALNDYRNKPDLFGRDFNVSQANISGSLASAAVLAMGEGSEQTPLCVLSDLPFVKFQPRVPSVAELNEIHIKLEEDLFAPFLENAPWKTSKL
ncbi:MAG: coenzyme F420-0:L-glutamate ligase [Candidatus Saccharimonadales bacterium]